MSRRCVCASVAFAAVSLLVAWYFITPLMMERHPDRSPFVITFVFTFVILFMGLCVYGGCMYRRHRADTTIQGSRTSAMTGLLV